MGGRRHSSTNQDYPDLFRVTAGNLLALRAIRELDLRYILLILFGLMAGCATRPASTQVPTLRYARNGVSDAKDFVNKANRSNNEIDQDVQKLLKESSE